MLWIGSLSTGICILDGSGNVNISGGTIEAYNGVTNDASSTGKIKITGTSTKITTAGVTIMLNSTKSNILVIGDSNSSDDTYPLLTSYSERAVQLNDTSLKFKMYSGRIRSKQNSDVYRGTNSVTSKSGYSWKKYSSNDFYGYRWKSN